MATEQMNAQFLTDLARWQENNFPYVEKCKNMKDEYRYRFYLAPCQPLLSGLTRLAYSGIFTRYHSPRNR